MIQVLVNADLFFGTFQNCSIPYGTSLSACLQNMGYQTRPEKTMERSPRRFYMEDLDYHPLNLSEVEKAQRYYRAADNTPISAQDAQDNAVKFQKTGFSQADNVIHEITKIIRYPQQSPKLFVTKKRKHCRGVVLHGPPGCGKTTICSSVRAECDRCNGSKFAYFEPKLTVLLDGSLSNNLEKIFDAANRLRPSVVFIDEIDAVLGDERIDRILLCILNGLADEVYVIVATNFPSCISEALRRPGRLEIFFELHLPTYDERCELLTAMMEDVPCPKPHLKNVAAATDDFSPAELSAVCDRAIVTAYERLNPVLIEPDASTWSSAKDDIAVTAEDLDKAVAHVKAKKPEKPDDDKDNTTA